VVPARSHKPLCLSVAADIGDKVLSKEFDVGHLLETLDVSVEDR
jgi:hypothetical protein